MTVHFYYDGKIVDDVTTETKPNVLGVWRTVWSHKETETSDGYCSWNGVQHGCHISFAQAIFHNCIGFKSFGCIDSKHLWARIRVFGNGNYILDGSGAK